MSAAALARPTMLQPVRKFIRSPKGYLLLVLVALGAVATAGEGIGRVWPGIVGAVAAAVLVDVAMARWMRQVWVFPSGAILTGLIVALVVSSSEPWYVPAAAAALGVFVKHAVRSPSANIFNPAAIGIVASSLLLGSGQSWWGALSDFSPLVLVLLLGSGVLIADRINKLPLVLTFYGSYFLLFAATAFVGDPSRVAEVFRTPDLNAVLFFAFFMLDDPPTSPVRYRDQVKFGILVALASYGAFMLAGVAYFLLIGVLVGNAWEAWRRTMAQWKALTAGRRA